MKGLVVSYKLLLESLGAVVGGAFVCGLYLQEFYCGPFVLDVFPQAFSAGLFPQAFFLQTFFRRPFSAGPTPDCARLFGWL
ncbi:MAG TPA: hypothetical protein VIM87_12845 [Chitinophaga sp.]|uniref:hypothetical protein n=1 Tax=Chitinophaga sp. TaxID=1869181 RepID=UPI002F9405CA